jgi:hypothetical protein
LGEGEGGALMRSLWLAVVLSLTALPAHGKQEAFWIEKVAVLAVGQGICGIGSEDEAMQTAIGSAMITHAIKKDAVIARARKRSHRILADLDKDGTRATFCQAFGYYLDKGFPR